MTTSKSQVLSQKLKRVLAVGHNGAGSTSVTRGTNIPLRERIPAVADTFDFLISGLAPQRRLELKESNLEDYC
jgi:response regulator RpfG family c-di-GMP phosphodiesterase